MKMQLQAVAFLLSTQLLLSSEMLPHYTSRIAAQDVSSPSVVEAGEPLAFEETKPAHQTNVTDAGTRPDSSIEVAEPLVLASAPHRFIAAPTLPARLGNNTEIALETKASNTPQESENHTEAATPPAQESNAPKRILLDSIIGPLKPQQQIFSRLDIAPTAITTDAQAASEQRLEYLPDGSSAAWQNDIYCWTAPGFFHNPLYFEQVNLERYGQGTFRSLQPASSAAHFFATIPILPYKIGGQHWCEQNYTLGHYRPGNRNPYQHHYHPFTWRGATYQAAATTGLIFVVP